MAGLTCKVSQLPSPVYPLSVSPLSATLYLPTITPASMTTYNYTPGLQALLS